VASSSSAIAFLFKFPIVAVVDEEDIEGPAGRVLIVIGEELGGRGKRDIVYEDDYVQFPIGNTN
jgi:hypothetical protein